MSEEKRIQFTLDGRTVEAEPGETVLSVANRYGIEIPALCNHAAISSYGACRLCIVEAFWGKRSKIVTSCIYTPWADERIETNNERVRGTRKIILEMLLARCPEADTIRNLARDYGVIEPRFRKRAEQTPPQHVGVSSERCILCGLCVRVCAEAVGQHAIGYAGRGTERKIATPFGKNAEECIGCGACVFVCPTDALHYVDVGCQRVMKELNTAVPMMECRVCGECFAAVSQVAKVRERLKLPDGLAETCPRCRGGEFREILERHIFAHHPARGGAGETPALGRKSDKE